MRSTDDVIRAKELPRLQFLRHAFVRDDLLPAVPIEGDVRRILGAQAHAQRLRIAERHGVNFLQQPPAQAAAGMRAAAGIEGVSFHSMRHAFASRMIDRGISSTVLAALMGHESSTITERRYIHLFDRQRTDEAVREAMASATG